jgi:hypothetical protein
LNSFPTDVLPTATLWDALCVRLHLASQTNSLVTSH